MFRLVAATLLFGLIGVAPTVANTLDGNEIRSKVSGKKIYLQTRFGEFPLRYSTSGAVTGDGSALGLARFFAPKETGKWWVRNSQLCQQWPTWYKGRTFCFELELTGDQTFQWIRDDGAKGKGRIVH
ncbi:unnamed protein product [Laminaria digitata]